MEYLSLEELSNELSISVATAKNWLRLGKINFQKTKGNTKYFSREYLDKLLVNIRQSDDNVLKSRRNKNYIKGNFFYKDYVPSSSKNIKTVESLLNTLSSDRLADEDYTKYIVADCAIQLLVQAKKISSVGENFLLNYLENKLNLGFYSQLIDFFIEDKNKAILFINKFADLFQFNCIRNAAQGVVNPEPAAEERAETADEFYRFGGLAAACNPGDRAEDGLRRGNFPVVFVGGLPGVLVTVMNRFPAAVKGGSTVRLGKQVAVSPHPALCRIRMAKYAYVSAGIADGTVDVRFPVGFADVADKVSGRKIVTAVDNYVIVPDDPVGIFSVEHERVGGHGDSAVEPFQLYGGAFGFVHAAQAFIIKYLAVQVCRVYSIPVYDAYLSDTGSGKVQRCGRAEPSCTYYEDGCLFQGFLPFFPETRNGFLPVVSACHAAAPLPAQPVSAASNELSQSFHTGSTPSFLNASATSTAVRSSLTWNCSRACG